MAVSPLALAIAEAQMENHPAEPKGAQCPACKRVGLPENLVPCGARLAAARTIRRAAG